MKNQRRRKVQRLGKGLVILDPDALFSELASHSTRFVARKYHVGRRALTYRLREIDDERYEEIISRRRTGKTQERTSLPEDTWTKLENGHSLRSIAAENNVSPSVFHTKAREDGRYKLALRLRRESFHQEMIEAASQFREGKRLAVLSKRHQISQKILAFEIRQILGDGAYTRILKERKRNPSNKVSTSIIEIAAKRFKRGARLTRLADEYEIDRSTLRRRLRTLLGLEYYRIIEGRHLTRDRIGRLAKQFKNGESLLKLSNESNVPLTTLCRKLSMVLGQDYKDIIKERLRLSSRSKGADSLFEKSVEALLVQGGVPFKKLVVFEINGHRYRPDFVVYTVNPPLIIEATGMNREDYWRKISRKVEDYIKENYHVICVLPNQKSVLRKAKDHVANNLLINFDDFSELVLSPVRPTRESVANVISADTRLEVTSDRHSIVSQNLLSYLQKKEKG